MMKKQSTSNSVRTALLTLSNRRRGRDVSVFEEDIFITSYPKSGNTWLRFLLGHLIYGAQLTGFDNIEAKIPDIYASREYQLLKMEKPRLLKSHEYFDPRYQKVLYIVRDPRDVVLSYYRYQQKMNVIAQDYPLTQYVERFVRGQLDRYGAWHENVGSWLGACEGSDRFRLIRYEDMLSDPHREMVEIARFMGIKATTKDIESAVAFAAKDNMKRLEQQQKNDWWITKNGRKDISFVGSARSQQLDPASIEIIQKHCCHLMKKLNYI